MRLLLLWAFLITSIFPPSVQAAIRVQNNISPEVAREYRDVQEQEKIREIVSIYRNKLMEYSLPESLLDEDILQAIIAKLMEIGK